MIDPIIIARHLSHSYRSGPLTKLALHDVSLEIARGSCVALIGVTGSGKSTLVQHFNGLLRPSAGQVIVDGIEVGAKGGDLRELRRRVGMLFQFPETQLFARTIYEDVAFGPRRMHLERHELRTRVINALEAVGLPYRDYGNRSPFELSGGQRRRVALATVLAMSPSVLILDEPTVGLDASGRAEFYACLREIQRQGVTIVLVSHDMTEVAALASQVFVLYNAHLVMQGAPRSIFAHSEKLREWGLSAPQLSELLGLLRKRGLAIPPNVLTLNESFDALWRAMEDETTEKMSRSRKPG